MQSGNLALPDQPTVEIRALVADSLPVFATAVSHALSRNPDLKVVGRVHSGREAVAEAARVQPDVVLLDAEIQDYGAIETARLLREADPSCRVVLMAAEDDGETLARGVGVGISGYVSKKEGLDELIEAARAANQGESYIPRPMLGPLLAHLVDHREERDTIRELSARLTPQERVVLGLLSAGATNRAIADTLTISPQTARTHVQHILRKLEVHSRLEATALVMRNPAMIDSTDRTPDRA